MGIEGEWKELESVEVRRLEKEEKKMRSELIKRKKAKYGKAGKSKLSSMEEAIITSQTRKLSELEETRRNIGKKDQRKEGWKINPEGREIPISMGSQDQGQNSELDRHWQELISSMKFIEKHERWVNANGLERSSLEEQRSMLYGTEREQQEPVGKESFGEMLSSIENDRKMHQDCQEECSQRAGVFQREGQQGGKMCNEAAARRRCTERATMQQDAVKKKEANRKETTTRNLQTSQVEDRAEEPTKFGNFRRFEDDNSEDTRSNKPSEDVMFENDKDYTHSKSDVVDSRVKDPHLDKSVKMKSEMRTASWRKDAVRRPTQSKMLCHERSPGGGKVMKKRGTPIKPSRVKTLKKLFEAASSSPTRGLIELQLQSSWVLNPANPGTTTGCARQRLEICVDQPGVGLQTGPRQTCDLRIQLGHDWTDQAGLGLGDQSQHL